MQPEQEIIFSNIIHTQGWQENADAGTWEKTQRRANSYHLWSQVYWRYIKNDCRLALPLLPSAADCSSVFMRAGRVHSTLGEYAFLSEILGGT